MRVLSVLVAAFLPTVALAGTGPQVEVADDGTIVGRVVVDAPEAEVRTAIPGVISGGRFDSILELKMTADGACHRVFRRTRGLWQPLEMYTRLCPTARGWRESLVQSDDYDAYDVEWSVVPRSEGGSEVRLTVRSSVDLPVPSSLVQAGAKQGVNQSLAELLRRLFQGKGAK